MVLLTNTLEGHFCLWLVLPWSKIIFCRKSTSLSGVFFAIGKAKSLISKKKPMRFVCLFVCLAIWYSLRVPHGMAKPSVSLFRGLSLLLLFSLLWLVCLRPDKISHEKLQISEQVIDSSKSPSDVQLVCSWNWHLNKWSSNFENWELKKIKKKKSICFIADLSSLSFLFCLIWRDFFFP